MVDFDHKWVGTEKYHVEITSTTEKGDLFDLNLNNGAHFVTYDGVVWHYDSEKGPQVYSKNTIYIYNSRQLNANGKRKVTFTITESDLLAIYLFFKKK